MELSKEITTEELKKESNLLIRQVNLLSEELPKCDISSLSQRLNASVKSMTEHIETSFSGTRKIDKVRAWIKLSVALKECRDTLDLISKLKFANTSDIILKVDNFNQMLIARQQAD